MSGEMRIAAVYRLLYGADFIAASLASVLPFVDGVYLFVGRRPFGGRDRVRYAGRDVYFPEDYDGLRGAIERFRSSSDAAGKIRVIDNPHDAVLLNQMGTLLNEYVLPSGGWTHVLMVEADEVWREDRLAGLIGHARRSDADEFLGTCDLFWRSPRFVSGRENPYCVLRALKGRRRIGETAHALMERSADLVRERPEAARVHNFGYAASSRCVFWKHMTALSFSNELGLDSACREGWFEDVWRAWHWERNRRTDLCPSRGHEDAFAPAEPYPEAELPPALRARLRHSPLPEWIEAGEPGGPGEIGWSAERSSASGLRGW